MERFAIKIDKTLKLNLYKICRLCGIDNPNKVKIINDGPVINLDDDGDPEMWKKIYDCVGIRVSNDDKMPQFMCTLCYDKINDFHEFREMCSATNVQTRKLLGLKDPPKPKLVEPKIEIKSEMPEYKHDPMLSKGRGRKRKQTVEYIPITPAKQFKIDGAGTSKQGGRKSLEDLKKQKIDELRIKTEAEIKQEPVFDPRYKEKCPVCSKRFTNKSQLKGHMQDHTPTIDRFHCVYCNETIKKNVDIKNHNLWHRLSKTPFQCGRCGKTVRSVYFLSKHMREFHELHNTITKDCKLVPDRQCNTCKTGFPTTFLFNTHPCLVSTKICYGCNNQFDTVAETSKHIPRCPKAFQQTREETPLPNLRIKTEPMATEATSVEKVMARINAPPTMDPSQCVVIPSSVAVLNDDPKSKRNKRVTKKDLKRFDELLKSTMTTLVSIKHEPIQEDPPASTSRSPSPPPTDDFHNAQDDEDVDYPPESGTVPIKQEIIDEGYTDVDRNIQVNIKKEVVTRGDIISPTRAPILKLKISKDGGQLNSSIVDINGDEVTEKKKKKKKKKDKEDDCEDKETGSVTSDSTASKNESSRKLDNTIQMPMPGVIRIKQEIVDSEYGEDYQQQQSSEFDFPSLQIASVVGAYREENLASNEGSTNLQIASVVSGAENVEENDQSEEIPQPNEDLQENEKKTSSPERSSVKAQAPIRRKSVKPKEDLPKILAVSSGVDFHPESDGDEHEHDGTLDTFDMSAVVIKQEGNDEAYGDETEPIENMEDQRQEDEEADENEFIDFSNVKIKQEIEITEEQFGNEMLSSDDEEEEHEEPTTQLHDTVESVGTEEISLTEHDDNMQSNKAEANRGDYTNPENVEMETETTAEAVEGTHEPHDLMETDENAEIDQASDREEFNSIKTLHDAPVESTDCVQSIYDVCHQSSHNETVAQVSLKISNVQCGYNGFESNSEDQSNNHPEINNSEKVVESESSEICSSSEKMDFIETVKCSPNNDLTNEGEPPLPPAPIECPTATNPLPSSHSCLLPPTASEVAQNAENETKEGTFVSTSLDLLTPVLHEEVQNLLNEQDEFASSLFTADSVPSSSTQSSNAAVSSCSYVHMDDINEIAENNNNANIEKELQQDENRDRENTSVETTETDNSGSSSRSDQNDNLT